MLDGMRFVEEKPSQGKQIQALMQIYFDNFTGEIPPSRGQMAGQLALILKEVSYEKIEPLVKQVAIEGQIVTRNTLIQANRKSAPPPPTKIPERFQPDEMTNHKAVPMPDYVREVLKKYKRPL